MIVKTKKKLKFMNHNFIAIEGNIGVGKTSLARMISEDYNSKLILESFAENPFLPKFYKLFVLQFNSLLKSNQV